MDAVLLKYANLPLGAAGELIMPEYWNVLDVAAEAVEQTAYPGTTEARKRYALALRRCAREMRDARGARDRSAGRAMWRARVTLELSLDDGTLGLWDSSQALVDSVGLKADGTSQGRGEVSEAAWGLIWDYAVVSRLRQVCADRFAGVADNREYKADQAGRILDDQGEPLVWTWDGIGSGILNGEAGVNMEAERALKEAMEETGATRILSLPNWADSYEESPEYRALCIKQAILCEGTTAVACEALADLLDRGFGIPRLIAAFNWGELDDEGFERLIWNLVSAAPGYSNVRWMTSTRAPGRGRDISATKTIVDPLSGSRHLHVVFQCKHWLSRSIAPDEVAKLVSQMELSARPVEELVIATSGRFSSDAEQWVEKHNCSRKVPRIDLWPNSHLESLIAQRRA
ncbi:MAG: hypothetical protein JWN40_5550 [Phycisphaerales bacterium]|nr:hypothetical protein [Phycisphaerales bacterium]